MTFGLCKIHRIRVGMPAFSLSKFYEERRVRWVLWSALDYAAQKKWAGRGRKFVCSVSGKVPGEGLELLTSSKKESWENGKA